MVFRLAFLIGCCTLATSVAAAPRASWERLLPAGSVVLELNDPEHGLAGPAVFPCRLKGVVGTVQVVFYSTTGEGQEIAGIVTQGGRNRVLFRRTLDLDGPFRLAAPTGVVDLGGTDPGPLIFAYGLFSASAGHNLRVWWWDGLNLRTIFASGVHGVDIRDLDEDGRKEIVLGRRFVPSDVFGLAAGQLRWRNHEFPSQYPVEPELEQAPPDRIEMDQLTWMVRSLDYRGLHERAESLVCRWLDVHPDTLDRKHWISAGRGAWQLLGDLCMSAGRESEALDQYRKSAAADPARACAQDAAVEAFAARPRAIDRRVIRSRRAADMDWIEGHFALMLPDCLTCSNEEATGEALVMQAQFWLSRLEPSRALPYLDRALALLPESRRDPIHVRRIGLIEATRRHATRMAATE